MQKEVEPANLATARTVSDTAPTPGNRRDCWLEHHLRFAGRHREATTRWTLANFEIAQLAATVGCIALNGLAAHHPSVDMDPEVVTQLLIGVSAGIVMLTSIGAVLMRLALGLKHRLAKPQAVCVDEHGMALGDDYIRWGELRWAALEPRGVLVASSTTTFALVLERLAPAERSALVAHVKEALDERDRPHMKLRSFGPLTFWSWGTLFWAVLASASAAVWLSPAL